MREIYGIGGNFNIHCPKILEEPIELEKPIEIEFYQIFEKKVSNIPMQGIVKALSKNCAIISTNFELMPFDNFEIRLKKNVYFKVISKKETGFLIVFTSDSSYLTQT